MPKIRMLTNALLAFMCPGCQRKHIVSTDKWTWNKNLESPTLAPSILVTRPAVPEAIAGYEEYRQALVCHSFIREGRIEYLPDTTHSLTGQTVELPDYPQRPSTIYPESP